MGLFDILKRAVAQVNPLDNGRTYKNQTPTGNASGIQQLTHNGATNVAGNVVRPFAATADAGIVEPLRQRAAMITDNPAAYFASQRRGAQAGNQSLPGLFVQGVRPFEQSLASTILAPVASRVANQQEAYANRVLGKAYAPWQGGQNQAEIEAGQAKLGILNDPLNRAGLDYRDPLSTTARKVLGQGAQAATTIATAGKGVELPEAATSLGTAAQQAGVFGALNAAGAVGGVAQQDAPTVQDYVKNALTGFGGAAAVPLAIGATPFALKGAGKVAKSQAKAVTELAVGNPKPFKNISDAEVGAIERVRKSMEGWGDVTQPGDFQTYRSLQKQLGATSPEDYAAIDKVIGARRTYDTRKGALQGGYVSAGGKEAPPEDLYYRDGPGSFSPELPPDPRQATRSLKLDKSAPVTGNDYNTKQGKQAFMGATDRYLGSKEAGKTANISDVKQLPQMGTDDSLNFIDAIERGISDGDFSSVQGDIRQLLETKYAQLRAANVDIGHIEDYFPHKWKRASQEQVNEAYRMLNLRSGIQEPRIVPTIREGIKMGYEPVTTDYRTALANYLNTADSLLANKQYFDTLKAAGFIQEGTRESTHGLQVIDAPGMPKPQPYTDPSTGNVTQGNYYAKPAIARQLNRLFSPQESPKALQLAAKASSKVQQVTLAGGAPGTPLNSFGIAQWTKQALSGHPITSTKAFLRSFSAGRSEAYFKANQSYIEKMQREGVGWHGSLNDIETLKGFGQNLADASGVRGKVATSIKDGWNSLVEDPTFARLMPSLQLDVFKGVYEKLIKQGVPEIEASKTAAAATKNAFGINSLAKDALKSKFSKDATGTFLFAPRFRESMITFWTNNLKALGNPTNPAYRENVKFLAGASALFAGMQAANVAMNGTTTFGNTNPNDRLNLSIPRKNGQALSIPFLSSTATVPRTAANTITDLVTGNPSAAGLEAKKFLSQTTRPIADLLTNQKYNGRQVYNPKDSAGAKLKDEALYVASQYNHPYVQAAAGALNGSSSGPLETAATAAELPIRFRNYDASAPPVPAAARSLPQDQQTAIGQRNADTAERNSILKAGFSTPDAKLMLSQTDADKALLAKNDPARWGDLYKQYQAAKKGLQGETAIPASQQTPAQQYKAAQKTYDDTQASMTDAQRYKAQTDLARKKVASPYSRDVTSLYGLSKSSLSDYLISHQNGADLANQLISYDNALYKAGIIQTPKFKNGVTPVSGGSRTTSLKKGFQAPRTSRYVKLGASSSIARLLRSSNIKAKQPARKKVRTV